MRQTFAARLCPGLIPLHGPDLLAILILPHFLCLVAVLRLPFLILLIICLLEKINAILPALAAIRPVTRATLSPD